MKTIAARNISLIFETTEDKEPLVLTEQLIDLLNKTLEALNLPENPQLFCISGEVRFNVTDWESKGLV